MYTVNVRGTSALLASAIAAGVRRWIQLSSIGVYGPPTCPVVTEAIVPMPLNEYERTKLARTHHWNTPSFDLRMSLVPR